MREPETWEQRKRNIGTNSFRRAIRPVPVLLFGVTTLRITWCVWTVVPYRPRILTVNAKIVGARNLFKTISIMLKACALNEIQKVVFDRIAKQSVQKLVRVVMVWPRCLRNYIWSRVWKKKIQSHTQDLWIYHKNFKKSGVFYAKYNALRRRDGRF